MPCCAALSATMKAWSRYVLMSRHELGGEPSVRRSWPTYTGFDGSLTSTNAVPSTRPTSAYSLPVCGSFQPQMSFRLTPRSPPIAEIGRNARRSTPPQRNCAASPPSPHITGSPVTALSSSGDSPASMATCMRAPSAPSKIAARPVPKSACGEPIASRPPLAAIDAPNRSPSAASSGRIVSTRSYVPPLRRYTCTSPLPENGAPTSTRSPSTTMLTPNAPVSASGASITPACSHSAPFERKMWMAPTFSGRFGDAISTSSPEAAIAMPKLSCGPAPS